MQERFKKELENFISPSDFGLFDLAINSIDAITTIVSIFSDRNDINSTQSFVLAIVKTMIDLLIGVDIDLANFDKFIQEEAKRGKK